MSAHAATKVSGATIECTMNEVMSVFRQRIQDALADRGIESVDAENWYPVAEFSAVLQTVEDDAGEPTLTKLGVAAVQSMEWDDTQTVSDGLVSLSDPIGTCHQGQLGQCDGESVEESAVSLTFDSPYPCSFDRGLIKGLAQELGAGYVGIDHEQDRCRKTGDATCRYQISW